MNGQEGIWLTLLIGFVSGFVLAVVTSWGAVFRTGRQEGYHRALIDATEIENARERARLQAREDRNE